MLSTASAGFGLSLIAAGVWLIALRQRRAQIVAASRSKRSLATGHKKLPVLTATELFEETGTLGMLGTIETKLGYSREHFQRCVPPVLRAYAEFVQLLPAIGSARYSQPGGMLIRTLDVVDLAVTFRRGQILPGGAAPEDIMQLEHRWTYAVLLAALLHDIGRLIARLQVTLYGPGLDAPKIWTPLCGPMQGCGAVRYAFDVAAKGESDAQSPGKLPAFLCQQWVPADIFRWLSADPALTSELRATLFGARACGSGAIRDLVLRAVAALAQRDRILDASGASAHADETHKGAASAAAAERVDGQDAIAVVAGTILTSRNAAGVDIASGSRAAAEEYLDGVEDPSSNGKATSAAHSIHLTLPVPHLLPPVGVPWPVPSWSSRGNAPPEAALRFMSWLQSSLADGSLSCNQTGAMVHFVAEGMLLVSPRIFQHFAKAFGEDGRGAGPSPSKAKAGLGMGIQRQCLKAGWHARAENGMNIHAYEVLSTRKPASRIAGVVITAPQRFVSPVPPANPHVVKAVDPVEGVKSRGLSD